MLFRFNENKNNRLSSTPWLFVSFCSRKVQTIISFRGVEGMSSKIVLNILILLDLSAIKNTTDIEPSTIIVLGKELKTISYLLYTIESNF